MRIEEYLQAPYHFRLQHLDDGDGPYWFATVEELPGCMSDGETEAEAMDSVRDAMAGWIMAAIEEGRAVPAPSAEPEYSGQFRVRLPAELHAALARGADRQGTSLNQLVVGLLAGGGGWRGRPAWAPPRTPPNRGSGRWPRTRLPTGSKCVPHPLGRGSPSLQTRSRARWKLPPARSEPDGIGRLSVLAPACDTYQPQLRKDLS